MRDTERRWQQTQKLEALGRPRRRRGARLQQHAARDPRRGRAAQARPASGRRRTSSRSRTSAAPRRAAPRSRASCSRSAAASASSRARSISSVLLVELEPLMRRIVSVRVASGARRAAARRRPARRRRSGQIEQAVLNLVVNGSDAMPDGGDLLVRLTGETIAPEAVVVRGARAVRRARGDRSARPRSRHSRRRAPHLFEPFFTTKDAGRARGSGSRPCTPRSSRPAASSRWTRPSAAAARSACCSRSRRCMPKEPAPEAERGTAETGAISATLLVAEDEPLVRQFVCATLRRLGCEVLEAESGERALALARVPGPHPPAAERRHHARHDRAGAGDAAVASSAPTCACCSCQAIPATSCRCRRAKPGVPLLAKPFGGDALEQKLREMLAGPRRFFADTAAGGARARCSSSPRRPEACRRRSPRTRRSRRARARAATSPPASRARRCCPGAAR